MKAIILKLVIICILGLFYSAKAQQKKVNVIYIGDSITEGGSAVTSADSALKAMGIDLAGSSNQGHSGFTTVNFLPGTETFKQVEAACNKLKNNGGTLVFSIMLGTNDSAMKGTLGAPVSKEQFVQNLKAIIDQLEKDFPASIFIIHRQTWYSPNTYNGSMYLQEGLDRLQSYFPQIKDLVGSYKHSGNGKVELGDTKAFDFFKKNYLTTLNPENGHQGIFYLHPNKAGGMALGTFWAKAIDKAISKN